MKYLLELRPGEGGKDARLLVDDLADIYRRFAESLGATIEIEERGGL